MSIKRIETVVPPREVHYVGDGFRVHNFIPGGYHLDMQRMNPFILLDYNSKFNFPPSEKPRGVGVHPHRGFETVTISYHGSIAHHDSTGNSGVIGEGDVQWMTAASGILHKEYHEKKFSQTGGLFQMVQLWVNLPAASKMSPPKYQSLVNRDINKVTLSDNRGIIEVIAGQYNDVKGSATTFTPIHIFNAHIKQGSKVEFSFPANYTTALLVIEGEFRVNDTEIVPSDHFVLFEMGGENFRVEALENSVALILSGEPISEPIVAQGPFVMNTQTQIVEAYEDYHKGRFGYLED